jgi:pimeloyl-ACP methyl ester carboxylesterase
VDAGDRGTLVFSHANGFPAGTYRLLFEHWRAAGWRVVAREKLGHDPARPVTSNWPHLREELLAFIEREAPGERVLLVGHSLGGFLSLLAASRRPGLARGIVLLDSPLIGGWKAHSLHMAKLTRLVRRVSPSKVAVKRRERWPSAQAALAHFAAKRAFAIWDPRVLADYVAAGTEPDTDASMAAPGLPTDLPTEVPKDPAAPAPAGGAQAVPVRLAFRREVEARIYDTLPHHLVPLLHRHPLEAPVAYIGGTRSVEGRQVGLVYTRALVQDRLGWVEGSHLFPMERPIETADAVLEQIARLRASPA